MAKEALASGESVYDLVIDHGWLTSDELDRLLDPRTMTSPMRPSGQAAPPT